MSFALLGVVAMQLYFLKQSYSMQSKLFDQSVNEALGNVADKLTRQDALNLLTQKAMRHDGMLPITNTAVQTTDKSNPGNQILIDNQVDHSKKRTAREVQLALLRDSLERMVLHQKVDDRLAALNMQFKVEQFTDEFGDVQTRITPMVVKAQQSPKKLHKYDTLHFVYPDPQFGDQVITTIRVNPDQTNDAGRL